jgi:pimeloyl-ACP methyl ester carboxylesterase
MNKAIVQTLPILLLILTGCNKLDDSLERKEKELLSTGTTEVDGGTLYYEVMGEGPSLVLIHGGGTDHRMWDDQFEIFAKHYKVIRYDVRGAGRSDFPKKPYSHSQDLYNLLRFLKIEKTSLIGLSRGGRIAVSLILEHPEMAQNLILVSSNLGRLPEAYRQGFAKVLATIHQEGLVRAIEVFLEDPFQAPRENNLRARQQLRMILSDNLPMFLFLFGSKLDQRLDPPVHQRLNELELPTMIISGNHDHPLAHANADTWEKSISGAQKVVMSDAAHLANMDQPEKFNQIVLDFLGSQP